MHNVQDAHAETGDHLPRSTRAPAHRRRRCRRLLGVDRSTVYRMAEDGRLPAVKVGRQWRFPADRIEAVLRVAPAPLPSSAADPAAPRTVPRAAPATEVAASVAQSPPTCSAS